MTANTGKVSHGASATALQLTLPTGSVAGEIVFVAVTNATSTTPATVPGTAVITAQAMGTGSVSMSKYTLTSTDISNGYVACSSGSAINWVGAVFNTGVSTAQGTATFNKRSSSTTSTLATAATITAGDTTVVFLFDKATSETGATVTPSLTIADSYFSNSTSAGSMEIGYYTGATADRTFTTSVASANGVGVQIGYTPAGGGGDPFAVTYTWWDGTTEQPVSGVTWWDGSAEQPISSSDYS